VTFRVGKPSPDELVDRELKGDSPWLVFSIKDTGVGMNSETQKYIFEAFNQGDGGTGRRFGGSGLGLSISQKLCELLGGQIHMESVEGKGSTFSLYLSLKPATEVVADAASTENFLDRKVSTEVGLSLEFEMENDDSDSALEIESSTDFESLKIDLSERRILICEDDMRTVFQISEVLDDLGGKVTLAPSWAQGVAEGKADFGFDFAIVSDRLADRPGTSSVAAWKSECGEPPYPVVALVSAEDGPHCEGADLVGRRPLVRDEFIGLIGKALCAESVSVLQ